jgi:phenylpropionate dioxygenase-like ring-hydroxylating dioxygenase large terminal subunit
VGLANKIRIKVRRIMQTEQSFTMNASFPMNAWYVVAWDVEAKTNNLLARTVCNKPLVIYRRKDGQAVVLEDACWHRLLPLSKGHLEGDDLVCGYHGLIYNSEGRCVYMPSQETINPSACVRSYPVVERHRYVWAWLGNPGLADPDKVPDLHWLDHPEWAGDGKLITVNCNYRLVVDNLMDLTHETFVHAGSIGDRAVAEAPFETTYTNDEVTVTRWMINIDPPPFWAGQLGKPGHVDRWQVIHFTAPCTIAIDVGVCPTGMGAPQGDRSQGVNGFVLNTITPATDDTCHYFWAFCRNYDIANQRRTHELREGVSKIFAQDEAILEAQQKAIDNNPGREFYNLNIDSGAMWSRRVTDAMVALEQQVKG